VIFVQGHPHELLTRLYAEGKWKHPETKLTGTPTDSIKFSDVLCWAGYPDPTRPIDSAVLIVKWTDQKALDRGDSILIWGYRWNPINSSGYAVTKYTIDMIRAVANADCRFSALLQNTSNGDFVVGGFGYNFKEDGRVPLQFYLEKAAADTLVRFNYTGSPNCAYEQGAIPYEVKTQVAEAIQRSTGGTGGTGTGIVRHPFDADYGYPAYDFDYWALLNDEEAYEWQSGWYHNGYWGFYFKNQLNGPFSYASSGVATQVITNHSASGFVFAINMDYSKDMSGDYVGLKCNCGCTVSAPAAGKANVTDKRDRK
jgi:hypothetical protein